VAGARWVVENIVQTLGMVNAYASFDGLCVSRLPIGVCGRLVYMLGCDYHQMVSVSDSTFWESVPVENTMVLAVGSECLFSESRLWMHI
jgi:hypothetical protein